MNWLNRIVHFLTIATRLTWAAAVPLLAWLFGVLFLVWPPQTVDLLTNETWIQAFAYHVAVAIWSISCWFWARWSLNLQPVGFPERLEPNRVQVETEVETLVTNNRDVAQPGRFLRRWTARLPLVASPFVAMIPLLLTGDERVGWVVNFLLFLLVEWWLVWLVAKRDTAATRLGRHMSQDKVAPQLTDPGLRSGRVPWRECFRRLPFGWWSFSYWIFGFAILCGALLLWSQVELPSLFGAPAIALVGLSAATGLITFCSVLVRRGTGFPGLPVVIVLIAIVAMFSKNHNVRTLGPDGQPAEVRLDVVNPEILRRPMLPAALTTWSKSCERSEKAPLIVLVATAGGASRAALWTASVLHQAEQKVGPQEFRRALFALSGVSGGSLGAAAYVASLPADGCKNPADPSAEEERWHRLRTALSTNFLAPPVAAYLSTDLLARVVPVQIPDRAAALEKSWEAAFGKSWPEAAGTMPGSASNVLTHAASFSDPFVNVWNGSPGEFLPLLLLNGTQAETGLPILTSPVMVTRDQFPLALDMLDLLGRDVRLSTAVSNSARFPIVTPGGVLHDRHPTCKPDPKNPSKPCKATEPGYASYVMDGGYIENFGADTIRDIVGDIDAWRDSKQSDDFKPHVLVIQISSDPSAGLHEVPRCGPVPAQPLPLTGLHKPPQALSDVFGPLITVADARGARGARTAGDLMRRKCPLHPNGEIEYVHFALCDQPIGDKSAEDVIGLNWALTPTAVDFLAGSGSPTAMSSCGNVKQMKILEDWFAKWTSKQVTGISG